MFGIFKRNAKIYTMPNVSLETNDKKSNIYSQRTRSPQGIFFEPFISNIGSEYDLLCETDPSTWMIETKVHGEGRFSFPYGKYNFVTMLDGTVRIKRYSDRDCGEHATLTSDAPDVLFAGELKFKDLSSEEYYSVNGRHIEYWTNHSDDYSVDSKQYKQAGLPLESFIPDLYLQPRVFKSQK